VETSKKGFSLKDVWSILSSSNSFFSKNLLSFFLVGILLIVVGIFYFKNYNFPQNTKVEVLENSDSPTITDITVEIAGEVNSPGVYNMSADSRVEDLLNASGGLTEDANSNWVSKYLNRAAKLTDSQKIYIPSQSEVLSANESGVDQSTSSTFSSDSSGQININTASLGELDKLPGIGPVYGQSIIDHRPYSTTEELVSKGAIKQNVYDKIKNLVSLY